MNLDKEMRRFRVASRELFNNFFRVDDPYNDSRAWDLEEDFSSVEEVLFQKMITELFDITEIVYGYKQELILVKPEADFAPWLLNRTVEESSGYWDHPIQEVTKDATLQFHSFFDFDQLGYRDNRYTKVYVKEWEAQPEAIGRYALIETQYTRFIQT